MECCKLTDDSLKELIKGNASKLSEKLKSIRLNLAANRIREQGYKMVQGELRALSVISIISGNPLKEASSPQTSPETERTSSENKEKQDQGIAGTTQAPPR